MKAMFINENEYSFAEWIADNLKTAETRNKRMLSALVGNRVAIASTKRNRKPMIIGYVDMVSEKLCEIDHVREQTMIPKNSKYDAKSKWCYFLANAERCDPFPLPADAVRHGRSWCEF